MTFALAKLTWQRSAILPALVLTIAVLTGCGTIGDRISAADQTARSARMVRSVVRTNDFLIVTYARLDRPGEPLSVYVEGDGRAWVTPRQLSMNPTPLQPVALDLAVRDRAANVIYVARPCQYVTSAEDPRCEESYWSHRRFAPEVVRAVSQAIEFHRQRAGSTAIDLVGFSGGGAVAALVAAERSDVRSLRTVAGNLDHVALHSYHKVTQLRGSLNALDVAARLAALPQIHYVGGEDKVVPPFVAQSFARAVGPTTCLKTTIVAGAAHESGWADQWGRLLRDVPSCSR